MANTALLLVLGVFLFGCAHPGERTPQSDDLPRIIDAHAHFGDDEHRPLGHPTGKMYEEYRRNNVVGAVVHASMGGLVPDVHKNAPVRFAVCAALTPGKQTVAKVERGVREGRYSCMKVYLGYYPRWANDRFYRPFYKLAEKLDVPVVFHTGDTLEKDAPVKYADPLQIDEIALAHPKVNFVIAHMGNPWFQSAAEVVYKDDNVYVDTSALMLGNLSEKDPEAIDELVVKPVRWFYYYVENPRKILFGTDWPHVDVASYVRAIQRAIPKKDWEDVFYNNALRVFPTLGNRAKSR